MSTEPDQHAPLAYDDGTFLRGEAGRPLCILAEYLSSLERFRRARIEDSIGAADADGRTIGLNISLPHEQRPNRYVTG